jgi:hypothetical protein
MPAGERASLQFFLDWQRATLLFKCAGLTGDQLAERMLPPSDLSLLGLIRHLTDVERAWFRRRFADEPVEDAYGIQLAWQATDPKRAAADYARLTEEFKLADAAAENAPLEAAFSHNGEALSLRFIYLHMIEEYARHNGHADLLRERIDGATGELGAASPATGHCRPGSLRDMTSSRALVSAYWAAAEARDWEAFGRLLADNVVYEAPMSHERVDGKAAYIRFNAEGFPGDWHLSVMRIVADEATAASWIRMADADDVYPGLTFFEIADGLIAGITDFWPQRYEPSASRAHLTERI